MFPPHIHKPNPLRSLFPSSYPPTVHRHRCSKAQTCIFKILHIISVFSAEDADTKQCSSTGDENCEERTFGLDLNISLRPPTEFELVEPPVSADGSDGAEYCVTEKNESRKGGSCDVERSEVPEEEERITRGSEISYVGDQSSGDDGVSEVEKRSDEGYLGMLIDAAQLILGEHETKPASRKYVVSSAAEGGGGGTKRKQQECWTAEWWSEYVGTLPALKSKRGRNLVLPEKYRDSFVEPLIQWTPAARRSKPRAETVRSKRRLK